MSVHRRRSTLDGNNNPQHQGSDSAFLFHDAKQPSRVNTIHLSLDGGGAEGEQAAGEAVEGPVIVGPVSQASGQNDDVQANGPVSQAPGQDDDVQAGQNQQA